MRFVKTVGSLPFAIFLIASLAVLLGVSTFMESAYGTPFAQKIFYRAGWFDLFLSLVWLNIFCATLTRVPFKRHHTGFVVTHIGILTLLIGALISRLAGVEGQMTLFEGEQKKHMLGAGHRVFIEAPGKVSAVPVELKKKTPYVLDTADTGLHIEVLQTLENASEHRTLVEGGPQNPLNRAIQATLSSEATGLKETFVLIERDPTDLESHAKQIGPARVELKTADAHASATLILLRRDTGETFSFPLYGDVDEKKLSDDLTLRNLKFFPHAKVKDGLLIDAPDEVRFNPAVQFQVTDTAGRTEEHTRLTLFPEFNSIRGGRMNDVFGLDVRLEAEAPEHTDGAGLEFLPQEDGSWRYRILSSKSEPREGQLQIGEKISTGWMDIHLEVHKIFNRANIEKKMRRMKPEDGTGDAALHVSVSDGKNETAYWLLPNRPVIFKTASGTARLLFGPETLPLPFMLKLEDFRKIDYPGTTNPAAFESDVLLSDPDKKLLMEKTIQMNKPLDTNGYRVFQSSYIQDERFGEASVFSIAKNPGIGLIYGGSVIIFIGVILLFYLHPFFTGKNTP